MSSFTQKECILLQTSTREIKEDKILSFVHKNGLNLSVNHSSNGCTGANSAKSCFGQIFVLFIILTVITQASIFILIYQKYCSLENQIFAQKEEIRQLNMIVQSRLEFQGELPMPGHNNEPVNRAESPGRIMERNDDSDAPHMPTSRRLLRRRKREVSRIFTEPAPRPGIHLKGLSVGGRSEIVQGAGVWFRWRRPDSTDGRITSTEQKITIPQNGLYLVYSQVTIAGREYRSGSSTLDPACGHETVRIRGQDTSVLLSSLLTQANRGQFYGYSTPGHPVYPLDTLTHHGVFLLERNDTLAVRTPGSSHGHRFAIDSHHNYFGAALISS